MNGSSTGTVDMVIIPAEETSYIIKGLVPVTLYMVTVYASNGVGRGRDSNFVNVTTSATGEYMYNIIRILIIESYSYLGIGL